LCSDVVSERWSARGGMCRLKKQQRCRQRVELGRLGEKRSMSDLLLTEGVRWGNGVFGEGGEFVAKKCGGEGGTGNHHRSMRRSRC
jgi:hypothetical protein